MHTERINRVLTWLALLLSGVNILFSLSTYGIGIANRYDLVGLFTDPSTLIGVTFSLVGLLIAYHRPRHMMGWVYLAIALSQSFGAFAYQYANYALITHPGLLPFANPMSVLSQVSWMPGLELLLTYALLLFPNGKVPAPGWRFVFWLSLVPVLISALGIFQVWGYGGKAFLENPNQFITPENPILNIGLTVFYPLLMFCGFLSVISLIYRFIKSQGIERAQIKWFMFAALITFLSLVISNYLPVRELNLLILIPAVAAIPLAAGIAILRYHLFDIDLIIRRTLLYSALTALMVIVYYGSVLIFQRIFRSLTGQASPAAIVISTLLIAALFTPLRQSFQRAIDRRFFRQQYDAERTLAAFGAQVRNSVDIDQLGNSLLTAVHDTLQPEKSLLWLRKINPKM